MCHTHSTASLQLANDGVDVIRHLDQCARNHNAPAANEVITPIAPMIVSRVTICSP
jgi:hypothetical protein